MTREERVKAVIEGREPDRIPCSVWMHFSEFDQDPRSLAECMTQFNEKYDYDYIKMMPFGAYMTPDWGGKLKIYCDKYKEVEIAAPAISSLEDYKNIVPLNPEYGQWGKTLQTARWTQRLIKPGTPFVQTIFSPATSLRKLAGGRMMQDIKEHPEIVHQALEAITETTIAFVKANIEAGVSGFFFATQCATPDVMDEKMYAEFCKPYDLRIIAAYKDITWFNIIHIHGHNVYFEETAAYPCNVVNWHDRQTSPSLAEARKLCSKTFLGGLREGPSIVNGKLVYDSVMSCGSTPEQVKAHIKEAIDQVDGKGLIIGPGCVADPHSPEENLRAVREAVER